MDGEKAISIFLSDEMGDVFKGIINLWPLKRYSLICSLLDSSDMGIESFLRLKFLIDYFGISICSLNCMRKIKEKICSMTPLNQYHSMLLEALDSKIFNSLKVMQAYEHDIEGVNNLLFSLFLETESFRYGISSPKIITNIENDLVANYTIISDKLNKVVQAYFATPLFSSIFQIVLGFTFMDLEQDKILMQQIEDLIEQYQMGTR